MGQYNTVFFRHDTYNFYLDVCVVSIMLKVTKVMSARGMMGKNGLVWQNAFIFKFVVWQS